MMFCCEKLTDNLRVTEERGLQNPDSIVCYSDIFDEYGLLIHDGGESYVRIKFCPWCGKQFPESKRIQWFEALEALGIEEPLSEEIPPEFKSDQWWRKAYEKE